MLQQQRRAIWSSVSSLSCSGHSSSFHSSISIHAPLSRHDMKLQRRQPMDVQEIILIQHNYIPMTFHFAVGIKNCELFSISFRDHFTISAVQNNGNCIYCTSYLHNAQCTRTHTAEKRWFTKRLQTQTHTLSRIVSYFLTQIRYTRSHKQHHAPHIHTHIYTSNSLQRNRCAHECHINSLKHSNTN